MRTAGVLFVLCWASNCFSAEPVSHTWTVGEEKRTGLLAAPAAAKEKPSPVVFAIHGHGGTARNAARSMKYHVHWPEAIVVYLQGLPTPGRLTDPEGRKAGWQHGKGEQNDRDLKFFDEVLSQLKWDFKVDESRIYCTGHSNGGGFTYLLWSERGDTFAAVAPSGAVASPKKFNLKPLPVMHIAGEKDELVKFEWQKLGIEWLRTINGCGEDGKRWQDHRHAKIHESKTGTPVVTFIHPGGHAFPSQDAPPLVVAFFKEHQRK